MSTLCFAVETWNVRGLGEDDKCTSVCADLAAARPGLVALQETKLSSLSAQKIASSFLPIPATTVPSMRWDPLVVSSRLGTIIFLLS
jgi:exonuclease III